MLSPEQPPSSEHRATGATGAVQNVVFIGASTAFFEITELLHDLNASGARYRVVAILDDDVSKHGTLVGDVPVRGGLATAAEYPDAAFVFGIGSHRTRLLREALIERTGVAPERFPSLVHPLAKVYRSATLGAGTIVHCGAVICHDAVLEPFAIVTFQAVVGPSVRVRRAALVASGAVLLTGADIGAGAFIGAAACIAEQVRVGPGAMVGMGTNVYSDVRPGAYVLGSPPRILRTDEVPPALLSGW